MFHKKTFYAVKDKVRMGKGKHRNPSSVLCVIIVYATAGEA